MKYVVTNFAYGTGPYLRTTELALSINNELQKRGRERLGIVVPLVYSERQLEVMREEFSDHADEIFLDESLGKLLGSIFYKDERYEEMLARWIENAKSVSEKVHAHLSGTFSVASLSGEKKMVKGSDILFEINRSPRIRYDIGPSYFTTFAYVEDILGRALKAPKGGIAVSQDLLEKGKEIARFVEEKQTMRAVAYPATFSWEEPHTKHFPGEILAPPISRVYPANTESLSPGIFVTITGIPGLERLYKDAERLGLKLYSNDTNGVPESTRALPHVIPNKNIVFQFARAGWSSIWLSMISGTPLVVPEYDPTDDPEIYFNNHAVEQLGIGVVYRGQKLEQVLHETARLRENSKDLSENVLAKFGTLDGNQYCAKLFAEHFLSHL